jgi:hypothetical protein
MGTLIFLCILLATVLLQRPLERTAIGFISDRVTLQLHEKIDNLLGIGDVEPKLAQKLFLTKYQSEVLALKQDLDCIKSTLYSALTDAPAAATTHDLIKAAIVALPRQSKLWEYQVIQAGLRSLATDISSRYHQIWSDLTTDIRIFSAINCGSFLLVLALVYRPKTMPPYLSLCAWVLLFSTAISILIYVYSQNWFYTILFNKYYGTSYFTLLSCIFGYLLFRLSIEYGVVKLTKKSDFKSRWTQ